MSGAKYRKKLLSLLFSIYSPMSGMRQFLSVYCFSWINDLFFWPPISWPQGLCTGRDQAAMQINYSWSYLKTIRSSNLLCLFSWVNFACVRPNNFDAWIYPTFSNFPFFKYLGGKVPPCVTTLSISPMVLGIAPLNFEKTSDFQLLVR